MPIRFRRHVGAPRKNVVCSCIRPAYSQYHRGWFYFDPVFSLALGQSRLVGVRAIVGNPKAYGGVFQRGDRVLLLHFFSRSRNEAFRLLAASIGIRDELAAAGYKGAYGDTVNAQLPRMIVKLDGFIAPAPAYKNWLSRMAAICLALWNVVPIEHLEIGYGIPTNLLGKKFQRAIMRF